MDSSHIKTNKMTFKTTKLENQGLENKTLWYLVLTNEQGISHHINIGERTYNIINNLLKTTENEKTVQETNQVVKQNNKR